jgi:predicted RNA binding protein YcfA (HicA-like mRNA interferase family)
MSEFPSVSGKKLLKFLKKEGFVVARVKGSHHFLKDKNGNCTTVPVHKNENLGIGLLLKILKDCDIPKQEFIDKMR